MKPVGTVSGELTSVLVVGTGSIGQHHARLLAERNDVDLWVCDIDESCLKEALQVAPGARGFGDFEAALEQGPQAVMICTPHDLHRPMAEAACQAGCDVFCEKPLAQTVADAEAIVATAQSCGCMLQVGYVSRFHPAIRRIQQMVDSGALGTLVGGRVVVGTYYTLVAARRRYQTARPNALILDYTHQPDYLSLFFGEVKRVAAETTTLGNLELIQQPNIFSLILRYKSSALVQIHLDFVQYPNRHILELFGDQQTVVYDFSTGALQIFTHGEESWRHAEEGYRVEHLIVGRDDIGRDQINAFLEAMRDNRTPVCTGADGVSVLRTAEAAVRAAEELRVVEV